jgi:murein DD-endopeptidase MepM/ murein hydrolase activator NlpD
MLGVALLFLALTAYPAARANAYFAEDSFAPFWQQDVQATGTRPAPPAAPELTHRVASGETLWSLARYYHVDLVRLMAVNRISDPARLSVGQDLVIPGRTAQSAAPAGGHPAGGNTPAAPVVARGWNGFVTWPLLGELTQQFGPQADGSFHHGLDIAGNTGMTVRAAQRGLVIYAGWLPIYGFTVIIDHGSGFRTLYAHLHDFLVRVGDFVEQGQVIAHVGSSGNASGPHLHFEVRRNNQSVNPLPYLVGN